jgi:hypothetical protein
MMQAVRPEMVRAVRPEMMQAVMSETRGPLDRTGAGLLDDWPE